MKSQPYTKNYGELRNASAGETVFPREEHSNSWSKAIWPALKIYRQIAYRLSTLFMCLEAHTHTHTHQLNKKEAMNLKEQDRWICERVWRKDREGEKWCNYIIISKKTFKITSKVGLLLCFLKCMQRISWKQGRILLVIRFLSALPRSPLR